MRSPFEKFGDLLVKPGNVVYTALFLPEASLTVS